MTSNPAPNGGANHGDRDRSGSGSPGAARPSGRAGGCGCLDGDGGADGGDGVGVGGRDCGCHDGGGDDDGGGGAGVGVGGCGCGCHDRGSDGGGGADGRDGDDGGAGRDRVPPAKDRVSPAKDGVAPARSEVDGIDWSGGRAEASLGRLLTACADADAVRRRQVEALIRAVEEGAAEAVLGVPLEVVLSQTGRATAFETRRLLRAARVLARMPAVRAGFAQGWLSWSQVDAICHHIHRLPVARWDELDDLVADRMVAAADAEADAIVEEVEWAAAKIREQRRAERKRQTVAADQLRLTPRADASGELHAEYGPDRFPLVEAAIDHAARRLLADVPDPEDGLADAADDVDPDGSIADSDESAVTEAHRHAARLEGRNAAARAAALFELVTGRDHATLAPLDDDTGTGRGDSTNSGGGGARRRRTGRGVVDRPGVVVTAPLDSLLDGSVPAHVISRLSSTMRVTAETARRWLDADGADIRLVVTDGGRPVGVGRATSVPPGWLTDAIVATQPTDTAPCSSTPAVLCDMEHAIPYADGGPTDVVNVAPVSRRWHTRKTDGAIQLHRDPDSGVATWTATRSGYTVITWPAPHLDDTGRTDRLTPEGLRDFQDVPHPADHVPVAKMPHTAGLDIRPSPADLACTVFSHDGRQLVGDRAPP